MIERVTGGYLFGGYVVIEFIYDARVCWALSAPGD